MTIREWSEDFCYQRGMFEGQARDVVDRVIADPVNESLVGRWDQEISHYPEFILGILALSIKKHALAYIDEKKPEAWYRELFL